MINNLSETNSVVSEWISQLRDVTIQKDRLRFRKNLERIGSVIGYEISKQMEYTSIITQTPLGESTISVPESQPVIATILRAGLPLFDGLLNFFDNADCAFVGAYRKHDKDETSFEIYQQYFTCPDLSGRTLILADSMLATGSSLVLAIKTLLEYGKPAKIHIVSAIGCSVGTEYVQRHFPDAELWMGVIDDELTAKGYIVPGLGDAGDLCYGSKKQA